MSNVERPKASAFFDMEAKLRAVEARLRRPDAEAAAEPTAVERTVERPRHPILTRRLRTALVIFDGVLDARSIGELGELRQGGRAIAPPALLIDLAQAAAMRARNTPSLGVFSLQSFATREPLPTDSSRIVQVVVGPDSGGDRVLAVFSQDENDPTADWILHAETFVAFDGSNPQPAISEGELRSGVDRRAPDDAIASAARTAGIELGSFARFEEIWLGPDVALARLCAPSSVELGDRPVHPIVLDSAMLLAAFGRGSIAQPVGASSIRVYKRSPAVCWCRASSSADLVELRDESGQLIAELRGLTYSDTYSDSAEAPTAEATQAPAPPPEAPSEAPKGPAIETAEIVPSWEGLLGSFRPGEWIPESVPAPFTANGHLAAGGSLSTEEFEPLDMLEEVEVDAFDLEGDESKGQPTEGDFSGLEPASTAPTEGDFSGLLGGNQPTAQGDFSGLLNANGDTWQATPGAEGLGFSGLPDLPPISTLENDLAADSSPEDQVDISIDTGDVPAAEPFVVQTAETCAYRIEWVSLPPLTHAPETAQRGGWLIVSDDKPFGVSLAERFLGARQGCTFKDLAGTDLEGWRAAVKQLRARPERRRGIVFFAASHRRGAVGHDERSLRALLDIGRAAVELDDGEPIRIWVVTQGARDGSWTHGAELAGIGQFLRTTHPWHFGALIDCEVALSSDVAAARIASEVLCPDGEGDVKLTREARLGSRWVREDRRLEVPELDGSHTYFIVDCSITLALELVRWMGLHGAKSFVLAADRWPDAAPEYAELDSLGMQVRRVVTDLSVRPRVDQLLALGKVGGVIHGAGLTANGRTDDQWETSLGMLRAVENLGQALEHSTAFFVLLSKNAVFARDRVATAIAQSFLDALALHSARLGSPVRSLSFGPWDPVSSEEPGLRVLTTENALRNVFGGHENRIVADVEWTVFRERFADRSPFSLVDPGAQSYESNESNE